MARSVVFPRSSDLVTSYDTVSGLTVKYEGRDILKELVRLLICVDYDGDGR